MQTPDAPLRPSPSSRVLGDESGATAVEFGLIAVPFFALLGAIIQIAFMTWAQENLDFTFQTAARAVFTGQFETNNSQTSSATTLLTAIRNSMCGSTSKAGRFTAYNCSGLKVDFQLGSNSGSNFAGTTFTPPVDPSTHDWATGFGTNYACAPPGTIVIATAAVKFPLFFRLWNAGLSSFSDGSVLLQSTLVFRTEPYALAANSPC